MAAYPHLFLPLKVGAHFLKNRIVMAPIETGLEKQDFLDPRLVAFYEERARGNGPGLFIVGNGVVHETGLRKLKDPVLTAGLLNNAVRLTSVIHDAGAKILLQLQHHGAEADHMFAVSASCFRNRDTKRTLHGAPGLLVSHLISQYALFAYHAVMHGEFDGVEVYGGRLSLPNVFSSRLFNRRHDQVGVAGPYALCGRTRPSNPQLHRPEPHTLLQAFIAGPPRRWKRMARSSCLCASPAL